MSLFRVFCAVRACILNSRFRAGIPKWSRRLCWGPLPFVLGFCALPGAAQPGAGVARRGLHLRAGVAAALARALRRAALRHGPVAAALPAALAVPAQGGREGYGQGVPYE
ncbi:hypothetical protein ON010_g10448 [Phytophthora cinnamomi]|nr:hypothetical protein ON010_g10448 [Phytophthora cinnamomi]